MEEISMIGYWRGRGGGKGGKGEGKVKGKSSMERVSMIGCLGGRGGGGREEEGETWKECLWLVFEVFPVCITQILITSPTTTIWQPQSKTK